MNGSSAIFISNVDDYLAPSQACVNPLYNSEDTTKNNKSANDNNSNNEPPQEQGAVVVPRQRRRRPRLAATSATSLPEDGPVIPVLQTKKDPIKASMADCLACSGCVTTAETVLLEQQHSLTALKAAMNTTGEKILVATISPAVWADMLRHLQIPKSSTAVWQRKLATSLQQVLQVQYVLDGNLPLQWSLLESGEEFCRAYLQNHSLQKQPQQNDVNEETKLVQELDAHNTPSMALNSHQTQYMLPDGTTPIITTSSTSIDHQPCLPLLTSSCPALVCLVEKSSHSAVRHLSHTRSPMSMAGAWWRQQQQATFAADFFHLAFMPCHDKKLEASRKDFARLQNGSSNNTNNNSEEAPSSARQDVDLVLTTQEWFQMMVEYCQTKQSNNNNIGQQQEEECWNKEYALQAVKHYLESLPPAPVVSGLDAIKEMTTVNGRNQPSVVKLLAAFDDNNSNIMALVLESEMHDMEMVDGNNLSNNSNDHAGSFGGEESMDMEIDVEGTTNKSSSTNDDTDNTSFYQFGSGGLAEFVFRYAAWRLFDTTIPDHQVVWKPVLTKNNRTVGGNNNNNNQVVSARVRRANTKNRDYYQATLFRYAAPTGEIQYSCEHSSNDGQQGAPVLRFAIAYGLQTLQRVLEPFQANKSQSTFNNNDDSNCFDFIEAMACPSGCLNGGGQLRVADRETPTQTRERVAVTREMFDTPPTATLLSQEHQEPLSQAERQTRFHVVPPLAHTMGAAAGVAVKDTQW